MLRRHITETVTAALRDTPLVLLVGPRQAGKSTLAQTLVLLSAHLEGHFVIGQSGRRPSAPRLFGLDDALRFCLPRPE
jgi:energy-coupling factor transporter ATP-binding protein EcfA2